MAIDREHVFFDASPTAMLLLSPEGTISRFNRAAAKTLGTAPDRLVDRPILGMVVPDDRERVKGLFLRVLQGQQREWTSRFRRGDGAIRVQWIRAVPIEDGEGVKAILIYTRDLTATREGRPETVQLQTLLENLPGQFTVVADTQGRIRYSSGLTRTHFIDDADVIGSAYQDLLADEPEEPDVEPMLAAAKAGAPWAGTHWHRRIDGVSFPARVFTSPYLDPRTGRVLGVLIAGQDVGAEYDWRIRAQKAEGLAGVGEVVAEVADDFAAGLGRAYLALDPGTEAETRDEVRRLRARADALRRFALTDDDPPHKVDLEGLLRDAIAAAAHGADRPAVHFTAPAEPLAITGRPQLLMRLFEELLLNAAHAARACASASGQEGVQSVQVALTPSSVGAVVRISNPAPDGADEDLHRGFEPFFTTHDGADGLGLTLVRSIAQMHGGRAWSEDVGKGEVAFSVQLPSDMGEPRVRFRPRPLELSEERTVLVVDDEESVRVGVCKFLEKVGYNVREAWSGRSALAQITAGKPPELVLTDLKMQDGSGEWFLKQLSRDFPDLLRRTVIITGSPDKAGVSSLLAETGCPVVGKPFEMDELLELLDEVALRK